MKRAMAAAVGLTLVVFVLPLLVGVHTERAEAWSPSLPTAAGGEAEPGAAGEAVSQGAAPEGEGASQAPAEESATRDGSVQLTVLLEGEERTVTLEEYLWGVVAAEMPASFELEALKAQAIAARTYTLYRIAHPKGSHSASLCGDSTCCQAWISRERRLEAWGEEHQQEYAEKITAAIRETDGEIAVYGGEPILAVFHASSSGRTRSAEEVWGGSYSYLVGVESPEGDGVPNYYSTVTVAAEEFKETILAAHSDADLSGSPTEWLGEMTYDDGGLPLTLEVGGVALTTGELRTLFSLRSATLTAEAGAEEITFFVTGYGHGVGMSQYGAGALAQEGKTAEEIILWYYPGTEIGSV